MIGEAIIGSATLIVLGVFWCAQRIVNKTLDVEQEDPRRRVLLHQREHWASELKSSYFEAREAAIEDLKRIDRELSKC